MVCWQSEEQGEENKGFETRSRRMCVTRERVCLAAFGVAKIDAFKVNSDSTAANRTVQYGPLLGRTRLCGFLFIHTGHVNDYVSTPNPKRMTGEKQKGTAQSEVVVARRSDVPLSHAGKCCTAHHAVQYCTVCFGVRKTLRLCRPDATLVFFIVCVFTPVMKAIRAGSCVDVCGCV